MAKFGNKQVKCPLCQNEELLELGSGNNEANFGCTLCHVDFLIEGDFELDLEEGEEI